MIHLFQNRCSGLNLIQQIQYDLKSQWTVALPEPLTSDLEVEARPRSWWIPSRSARGGTGGSVAFGDWIGTADLIWLVVTGTWLLFFHILGMSSSQLTFIFFRGVETTNQWWQFHAIPLSGWGWWSGTLGISPETGPEVQKTKRGKGGHPFCSHPYPCKTVVRKSHAMHGGISIVQYTSLSLFFPCIMYLCARNILCTWHLRAGIFRFQTLDRGKFREPVSVWRQCFLDFTISEWTCAEVLHQPRISAGTF